MLLRSISLLLALCVTGCASFTPAPSVLKSPPPGAAPPESIRARAVVELTRDVTVTGRAVIAAKGPDKFRIEVFGPLGQVAATMVSDGVTLSIYSEGRLRHFDWDNQYFPYSFTARDIVGLLTGSGISETDGTDNLDRNVNYSKELNKDGRLRSITKSQEGLNVLRGELSDWRLLDGKAIPFRIHIDDGSQSITVSYLSIEVNPEFSPGTFKIAGKTR